MRPIRLACALFASTVLSSFALAGNGAPEPGSLLVFPLMDNEGTKSTFITLTNTNDNMVPIPGGGGQLTGSVTVHVVFINGTTDQGPFLCGESNSDFQMTPRDTVTFSTENQALLWDRGYIYAFARNPSTGANISWNYLIGSSHHVSPTDYFELNPFVFKSGRGMVDGTTTSADNLLNLNGGEYERLADRFLVPHFWGEQDLPTTQNQPLPVAKSDLVLINLTGGVQFTVVVDFFLYNDNENQMSGQTTFRCWARRRLNSINGMFNHSFLDTVSDNMELNLGLESGWYKFNGGGGGSSADSLSNAGILAVQIGTLSGETTANLPFTTGTNPNDGEILSFSIFHD